MRVVALASVAVFALCQAAWAGPVMLTPVSFSPEFQQSLDENLGPREGEILSAAVTQAVERALARRGATIGGGGVTVEIVIVDADPNRPTMRQLADQPSLDASRSVSIGGAELRAVLRGADGATLTEVSYRRYNHSLDDLVGPPSTWTEARRAINRFAERVADAYVAHASAR